jgi:hypothetical protein
MVYLLLPVLLGIVAFKEANQTKAQEYALH